ncbi:MAG: hypothetical protein Faunusvirus15_3 [Faunusvirus sp.]|jgi:hypothetical protein|uniref:Uncharacterized protein n=1 Tax=Faunusvirus sp. TaxID=2487766 RepID=A0A3G4ZX08_9VIRU|nr:MAG: hypothetical protein Faunusvirus15_3 [Faunusvirus sp.]
MSIIYTTKSVHPECDITVSLYDHLVIESIMKNMDFKTLNEECRKKWGDDVWKKLFNIWIKLFTDRKIEKINVFLSDMDNDVSDMINTIKSTEINKTTEIYTFSGKLGSGKNYIAENVFLPELQKISPLPTVILAFADYMKVDVCGKNNVSYDSVFVEKTDTTRKLLQIVGTEKGRMIYGEDVWTNVLIAQIKLYQSRGAKRFLITDGRFTNEADKVKQIGTALLRINAVERNKDRVKQEAKGDDTKMKSIMSHVSETQLDDYKYFDYKIENDYGDKETVVDKVKLIVLEITEKIRQNLLKEIS